MKTLYLLLFLAFFVLSCKNRDTDSEPTDTPSGETSAETDTKKEEGASGEGTSPPPGKDTDSSPATPPPPATGGGDLPASGPPAAEPPPGETQPVQTAQAVEQTDPDPMGPGLGQFYAIRNDSTNSVLKVRAVGSSDGLTEVMLNPGDCIRMQVASFPTLKILYAYSNRLRRWFGGEHILCNSNQEDEDSAPACPSPGHYQYKSYGDALRVPSDEEDKQEITDCLREDA